MTSATLKRTILPRLLRRERAAAYLDVSSCTFDKLVKVGMLPPPKRLHSLKVWDRDELDSFADNLPHDGQPAALDATWD